MNNLLKKRIYSFIVDLFIISLLEKLIRITYFNFINDYFYSLPISMKLGLYSNIAKMAFPLTIFCYFFYFLSFIYISNGKTLGKIIFKLKVESIRSETISFTQALLRSTGYLINYLFLFLPFIINLLFKKSTGLPDYISDTKTVEIINDIIIDQINNKKVINPIIETQLDLFR